MPRTCSARVTPVSRSWPYGFGVLGDGTRLDTRLRDLFDEYATAHQDRMASPFTLEGMRAFDRWLAQPAAGGRVSRALAAVYAERVDLQAKYHCSAATADGRLQEWAEEFGRHEEPLLARTMGGGASGSDAGGTSPAGSPAPGAPAVQDVVAAARAAPESDGGPLHREPWGVNVVGYFRSEAGTGEAARLLVAALDHQHIPVLPVHGQMTPVSRQSHPYETATPQEAPFPVNLICMNADMLPEFARHAGPSFFAQRYSIGLWFWEVEAFPERWRSSFGLLEEVWAPTAYIASALSAVATVPVNVVRLPVAPAPPAPLSRSELGLADDRFLFLFSFDYLSIAERKNPLAVIDVFRRSFTPGEGAQLAVKCINSDRAPDYHARLLAAAAEHPDVVVLDHYLEPARNAALPVLCDAYISLHRAEGFGLILADAMWHGKPVIATGYSGNLDFMTSENSRLVDFSLTAIGEGADPYPADGRWADPDLDDAARHMRELFEDRDAAGELGRRAARDIRRTHSQQAAGEILARRLASIRAPATFDPRRPWHEI